MTIKNEDEAINYAMPLRLLTDAQIIGLYNSIAESKNKDIAAMFGYAKETIDAYSCGKVENKTTNHIRFKLIEKIIEILEGH